jgi:uncharacterized protein (TIGR00255 family)
MNAYSMTGYGKIDTVYNGLSISVELKTVNNRFLEISTKAPRDLMPFENQFKKQIQKKLQRGSVFFNINITGRSTDNLESVINQDVVKSYLAAGKALESNLALTNDLSLSTLLGLPDVIQGDKGLVVDEDLVKVLSELVDQALDKLVEMRFSEGEHMAKDIIERITLIEENLAWIEENLPSRIGEYQTRLKSRITELLQDVSMDEARFAQEVAYMADKIDISEEIVRFASHNSLFRKALAEKGPHGKKLNFLLQEMGREANTLSTKSHFIEFQHRALKVKEELESIREQVANVE